MNTEPSVLNEIGAFIAGFVFGGVVLFGCTLVLTKDAWQKELVSRDLAEYVKTETGVKFQWKDSK